MKLRRYTVENWNVWMFTIRNLLYGTDDPYEVCQRNNSPAIIGI